MTSCRLISALISINERGIFCHGSGCIPGSLCCLCCHVFFSSSWQVQSALIWRWGCACHELLLFHLLLITLSFIFLVWPVLVVSRLFCVSVIVCALELGYSRLLCLYPRTRREKDCRSLPRSTLRWFNLCWCWILVSDQLVGSASRCRP